MRQVPTDFMQYFQNHTKTSSNKDFPLTTKLNQPLSTWMHCLLLAAVIKLTASWVIKSFLQIQFHVNIDTITCPKQNNYKRNKICNNICTTTKNTQAGNHHWNIILNSNKFLAYLLAYVQYRAKLLTIYYTKHTASWTFHIHTSNVC